MRLDMQSASERASRLSCPSVSRARLDDTGERAARGLPVGLAAVAVRERGQLLHARQQLLQAAVHQRKRQRGLLLRKQ